MKKIRLAVTALVTSILLFPLAVLAALPVPDPTAPDDFAKFIGYVVDAAKDKNYGYLLALGLIGLVWFAKKYGSKLPKIGPAISKFLNSDPGGVVAIFVSSYGVALAANTAAGVPLSGAILLAAAKMAFLAMGGYVGFKKLVVPVVAWLLEKLGFGAKGNDAANAVAADANKVAADGKASDQAAADALNKALGK